MLKTREKIKSSIESMEHIEFIKDKSLKKKYHVALGSVFFLFITTIVLTVSLIITSSSKCERIELLDEEVTQKPNFPRASRMHMPKPSTRRYQKQRLPKSVHNKFVRSRRVTGKPSDCNTVIAKCYDQHQKYGNFTNWIDVQIHFNDIYRRIFTLICIYAGKPLSCDLIQLDREEKIYSGAQVIILKGGKNEIQVLHESSTMLQQFIQSLEAQMQHEKNQASPKQNIIINIEKIIKNFKVFQKTMEELYLGFKTCSSCKSVMINPPKIQQFGSKELKKVVETLRSADKKKFKKYSDGDIEAQQTLHSLYQFLQQMLYTFKKKMVFGRGGKC